MNQKIFSPVSRVATKNPKYQKKYLKIGHEKCAEKLVKNFEKRGKYRF